MGVEWPCCLLLALNSMWGHRTLPLVCESPREMPWMDGSECGGMIPLVLASASPFLFNSITSLVWMPARWDGMVSMGLVWMAVPPSLLSVVFSSRFACGVERSRKNRLSSPSSLSMSGVQSGLLRALGCLGSVWMLPG